jgi:hypothetical protein
MGAKLLLMDFGVGDFGLKTAPFVSKGMPLASVSLEESQGEGSLRALPFCRFLFKNGL